MPENKITVANCSILGHIAECNEIVGLTLLLGRVLTAKYRLRELESIVNEAQLAVPRVLISRFTSGHAQSNSTDDAGQFLCRSFVQCCVSGEFEDPEIPDMIVTTIETKLRGLNDEQQFEDEDSFHKDALDLFKMLITLGKLRSKARINQGLIDTVVAFAEIGSFTVGSPSGQSVIRMTHGNKCLIIDKGKSPEKCMPLINVTGIKEGTLAYSRLEELLERDKVMFNTVITVDGRNIYTVWTVKTSMQ